MARGPSIGWTSPRFSQEQETDIGERYDVLSFIDVPWSEPITKNVRNSRQLAINNVPLDELLQDSDTSTGLVDGFVEKRWQVDFLDNLYGASTRETVANRMILGFCAGCLGNDGWLLCADFEIDDDVVSWRRVGFDGDTFHGSTNWEVSPLDPEVRFSFERQAYEAAIRLEGERVDEFAAPDRSRRRRGWFRKR